MSTHHVVVGSAPVLVHNCPTNPASLYFSAYSPEFLEQAAKYGKAGVRELPDGRFRFYDHVKKARTEGEMIGRRLVREWNPESGCDTHLA